MAFGYTERIRGRIENAKDGTIFIHADFTDITDGETARRTLNRLVKTNVLRRVLKGVFEKPRFSPLLQEYVATDLGQVANALARNYHWSIIPSGNTALNLLGLSTQVAATWSYRSDGPYKTYQINNRKITFKHRTNKEVAGLSETTALVIQALKELGKENVGLNTIDVISSRLSDDEKSKMLSEASQSTDWVFETIKKICERRPEI